MSSVALLALLAFAAATSGAHAQATTSSAFVPLASKHFNYPDGIPYQADSDDGVRGTQFGYNKCNSTTENQNSLCQTTFLNHLDDFCLWAPTEPKSIIGDTEGEEVAWCSKKGHGTRLIPAGALTGVQYIKTPDYVQVVGFIDQSKINIASSDDGGELDPFGADRRGNPLGGLAYTNAFSSDNNTYAQSNAWHNFMGSNAFCFKVCRNDGPNPTALCQHIYDRIGVEYNCPGQAKNGTFEACEGENQDPPGIYTTNGQVMTYTQPPESLGPIATIPYTARIPKSSNCVQFPSSALYTDLPGATPTGSSSASSSGGSSSIPTGTRSGSSAGASGTGAADQSNSAGAMGTSIVAIVAGMLAAVTFLA